MPCKPEWFDGDLNACAIYAMLTDLAHTWDDLVDRDKPVSPQAINNAFRIALFDLPANPLYAAHQAAFLPMWAVIVSAYETANTYEAAHDPHGIEISHTLRYAAGHIISYLVQVCVGPDRAREVMPDVWKDVVAERFDEYAKEHLK